MAPAAGPARRPRGDRLRAAVAAVLAVRRVPGGAAAGDDSPERTQVVRNTGEYQPNYGEYTQQQPPAQPGWNQVPPGAAAPPWGGADPPGRTVRTT